MIFNVYKIIESVNNFYYYFISHIEDLDLNLDIAESYADAFPDIPINTYFNVVTGWDCADIKKCDDISPIQVLNRSFPHDPKNMNVSEEYKKFTEQALEQLSQKKGRGKKKEKDPNEAPKPAKKPAKPRGKSSGTVKIEVAENKKLILD